MILVDTSVWIDFLKGGGSEKLEELILEDLVVTNEIILTELIPLLQKQAQKQLIESLLSIKVIPLSINWDGIRMLQLTNLNNGINKVGLPDLLIAQQTIQNKITLWSKDKHFRLMNQYMKFDLLEE